MKRNALALAASFLALALMAGPAAAQSGVQEVDDSTGALQVGAVAVDVPVRVASDGDSTTTGATTAGPQTTQDSTGAGQVGAVDADVPVRVLSDGGDAEPQAAAGAGEQSTDDTLGSAQVGAVDVAAPVRVASDGDDSSGGGAGAGSSGRRQTVSDSNGAAQVGSSSLFAPVRVLSGEGTPVDDLLDTLLDSPSGADDAVATPSAVGPTAGDAPQGRDWPSDGELRNLVDGPDPDAPFRFASGGASTEPGYAEALGVSAASLPLTGAEVANAAVLGLLLLTSGAGLRLVPGGRRR